MNLDSYFKVSERNSTLKTEILAGVSTFLSLSYILIVNPSILAKGGIDPDVALFATAIASGLACILMGVWARLPFVLAPGLEMNGFVVFTAIGTLGLTWQESLGAVFWSGILCLVLTALPIRRRIIHAIPEPLQLNLALSVGVFVATIGLFLGKIVFFEGGVPRSIGYLFSSEALSLYFGYILCLVFRRTSFLGFNLHPLVNSASFVLGIFGAGFLCLYLGLSPDIPNLSPDGMLGGLFALDLSPFSNPGILTVFLVLFLIDFFGSIGKFIGLTAATNLRSSRDGVVDIEKAMYVDGIGTVAGSLVGTTSVITYVESAIGIHAGGRTGVVAVVCGVLMLISLLFAPLIAIVPVVATSGILIYVGFALIPRADLKAGKFGLFDFVIGGGMACLSFATFSLDKAMLLGFVAYSVKDVSSTGRVNPYLAISACLLALSVTLQFYL